MRVVIDDGSAEDRQLLVRMIRDAFPAADIVEALPQEQTFTAGVSAAVEAETAAWPDEDWRAAALFPIENPNPVLRFARSGKLLFANRASRDLLDGWGLSEDGFLPDKWRGVIEETLSQGKPVHRVVPTGDRLFGLDFVPVADAGYVNIYGRDVTALRSEREVLKTIMEHTQAQLAYLDPQFNFVTVNTAYASGSGHSKEALVGRNHFDLFPNPENQAIFERVRDGKQAIEFRARPFEFTDQLARGTTYWDWRLTPVSDGDGPVKGLVLSLVDVTERVRAETLSNALNSIHTAISSSTDVALIMQILLARSVEALGCDAGGIGLREGDAWVLRYGVGLPETAHGVRMTDDQAPVSARVAREKRAVAIANALQAPEVNQPLMARHRIQAVLAVPLVVRNTVIGILSFNYFHPRAAFNDTEMDFARKLAVSASLALENANLIAGEAEQRRLAERRAAELEAALDAISDGVVMYDHEGRFVRQNSAALQILGLQEADGRLSLDERAARLRAVISDDPESSVDRMPAARALRGETVRGQLMRIQAPDNPDNAARYILVSAAPIPDPASSELGAVASFSDITERTQLQLQKEAALEKLRESQADLAQEVADLQQLQAISTQLIYQGDIQDLYARIVDAAIALLHSDAGSMQVVDPPTNELSLLAWRGLHPESAAFWGRVSIDSRGSCGAALSTVRRVIVPDIETCEFMADTQDLDYYRLSGIRSVQSTPLIARSGNLVGMISTHWREPRQPSNRELRLIDVLARQAADLVERSMAEVALCQANDTLEQRVRERTAELAQANKALRYQAVLLESISDAVLATDPAMRVTSLNRAAEEKFGWRSLDAIGRTSHEVAPARIVNAELPDIMRALAETGHWRGELIHFARDGCETISDVTAITLRDETGQITGYVTVSRDITERKRAEAELRASREQLQNLSRRLVDLQESERSYVANQLYNDEGQRLAALILGLGRIQKDGDCTPAIASTVTELLALADGVLADMHSLAVNLRPASLDRLGLAHALQALLEQFGATHGIEVSFQAAGSSKFTLSHDAEAILYRIVEEALDNVARHGHASHVGVMLSFSEDGVTTVVEDNGVGFEVDAATRAGHYGLIAMRERAKMIGGSLAVESRPGAGTTVYIQVPQRS